MLPDNFYIFIGAIESTVHFISTRKVVKGTKGKVTLKKESNTYDPLMAKYAILDETIVTEEAEGEERLVSDNLKALLEVKVAFLEAAAQLSRSLAPAPSNQPSQQAGAKSPAEIEAAWKAYYFALDQEIGKFLINASFLASKAPEWSYMDAQVRDLIMEFRKIASLNGGGSSPPATSWGGPTGSFGSSWSPPP